MARLGNVRGLHVLDYGCGHGMASVVLARRGARVTAFDLSEGYLSEASRRAVANGVHLDLVQADGQRLPFADAVFDRVWGNAVLHHLDLNLAGRELFRVLKPGGVAVFCEPWGENPLLRWARRHLPYPGKERTRDEEPLRLRHVCILRHIFPRVEWQGYQLLSMARRVLRPSRLTGGLERCDSVLLRRLPGLQRYCRYVVLQLHK
jgi:ubiquinone/menaquinone biosynthesis C-methylase UbiE